MAELSEAEQTAIRKIEGAMRIYGKAPDSPEGQTAFALANKLMEAYNLDQAIIEQNSGDKGKRSDQKLNGGLYHWQRELWQAVAELHFCMYWNQQNWDPDKKRRIFDNSEKRWGGSRRSLGTVKGGYTFQHRLVGRLVNTKMAQVMAEHTQQSIERITRERYPEPSQFFCASATSYREGLAANVISRLYKRRREIIAEDRVKAQEAADRAAAAARKGVSTETAISVETLAKTEYDGNIDFIYGDGTSARWAADRAVAAEKRRIAEEEHTKWAAANPEEAKAQAERQRKEERKRMNRGPGSRGGGGRQIKDASSYYQGRDDGDKIGIDQQADDRRAKVYI